MDRFISDPHLGHSNIIKFEHANLTDEYGEINEDSPHQTLTFSVHVKEQKTTKPNLLTQNLYSTQ